LYCCQDCQKKAWQSHKGPCKETEAADNKEITDDAAAEAAAAAAETTAKKLANDIQTLCAAGCGEEALERCSLCAGVKYCGRKCQKKHWPEHKEACKIATSLLAETSATIEVVDKTMEACKKARHYCLIAKLAENGNAGMQCFLSMNKHVEIKWFRRAADAGKIVAMFFCNSGAVVDINTRGTQVAVSFSWRWEFSPAIRALHEISLKSNVMLVGI
jgi:hypothetical protein